MPKQYDIHGADRKELPAVIGLLEPAYADLGVVPPEGVREYVLADSKKLFADWWVAAADQRIVGAFRTIIASETDPNGVTTAERMMLSDVVVDPDYRRRGLGSALIKRAIDFSEERLVTSVRLEIPVENIALHALAAKSGFGTEAPFVLELPSLGPSTLADEPEPAENNRDSRVPTPEEKKLTFLQSIYPKEEFSEGEIDAIFTNLPRIIYANSINLHPKIRKKLEKYIETLDRYVQTTEPINRMLAVTGFNNATALIAWKTRFAKALRVIEPEDMRRLSQSFAAQDNSPQNKQ